MEAGRGRKRKSDRRKEKVIRVNKGEVAGEGDSHHYHHQHHLSGPRAKETEEAPRGGDLMTWMVMVITGRKETPRSIPWLRRTRLTSMMYV